MVIIDKINVQPEKGILINVYKKQEKNLDQDRYHRTELKQLAESAGIEVLAELVQYRERIDSKWLIGKGKVQEIQTEINRHQADLLLFNHELSGMQVRNLEEALQIKIIDRTQLILDIFAGRAQTREGKIQVELAQLRYLLPRLVGHGKNLSRLGGGIGTRGPGETKLETDRRHIQRKIDELKKELAAVEKHRQLHRARRKKEEVYQIALVGYTNAGKSTLMRALTGADVFIEDRLFATLDPTVRRLELPNGKQVLLSDTVGFIDELPHELIQAFRATLEEAREADLLCLVIDSTSPFYAEQFNVVRSVLSDLNCMEKDQLVLFNKADACEPEKLQILTSDEPYLRISAFSQDDMNKVKRWFQHKLSGEVKTYRLPVSDGAAISLAYRLGEVLERTENESSVTLRIRVDRQLEQQLGKALQTYEAEWT